MTNHHPTVEQLTDYCSGALPLSHGICVSTHLEYCQSCAQEVARFNQIGGLLLEEFSGRFGSQDNNEELKDKVFAFMEEGEPSKPRARADKHSSIPDSLRQFAIDDFDSLPWKNISLSIKLASLLKDKNGTQVALVRTKPGGKMLHHGHTGNETTVVLKGSFSDQDGVYKAGDFVLRGASEKHSPLVTKDAECICLTAVDSAIQFTGFFARMLNPLLRLTHAKRPA